RTPGGVSQWVETPSKKMQGIAIQTTQDLGRTHLTAWVARDSGGIGRAFCAVGGAKTRSG
ncbi:MAG: hypothetical protein WBB64_12280, partial [Anaerolineales bacterium]